MSVKETRAVAGSTISLKGRGLKGVVVADAGDGLGQVGRAGSGPDGQLNVKAVAVARYDLICPVAVDVSER